MAEGCRRTDDGVDLLSVVCNRFERSPVRQVGAVMPRTRYEPEPRTKCCVKCFRDPYLRERIRDEGTRGSCDWCGATRVKTVHIRELTDDFREAVRGYTAVSPDEHGERLDFLFDDGFGIFSDILLEGDGRKREELLLAILEYGLHPKDDVDEPDFRDLFVVRGSSGADLPGRWDEQLESLLKHPPSESGPPEGDGSSEVDGVDLIASAVQEAGLVRTITKAYNRARIHKDRSSSALIQLHEMGAPKPEWVTKGARANRSGQSVLYLASDEQTALAEVRSWKGAVVAVAKMELARPVTILDVVNVPRITSPFGKNLSWTRDVRVLLRRFGRELSRPVAPDEEEVEYRPSQHICEMAVAGHLDGVAYPSAMGGGHNLVLFDPEAARPTSLSYHRIGRPTIRATPYQYAEMRWEEQ
jgi:hypothetical protein